MSEGGTMGVNDRDISPGWHEALRPDHENLMQFLREDLDELRRHAVHEFVQDTMTGLATAWVSPEESDCAEVKLRYVSYREQYTPTNLRHHEAVQFQYVSPTFTSEIETLVRIQGNEIFIRQVTPDPAFEGFDIEDPDSAAQILELFDELTDPLRDALEIAEIETILTQPSRGAGSSDSV